MIHSVDHDSRIYGPYLMHTPQGVYDGTTFTLTLEIDLTRLDTHDSVNEYEHLDDQVIPPNCRFIIKQ